MMSPVPLVALLLLGCSCLSAVTPAQVDAIIRVESAGNPAAVGRFGERGLCQFFPSAWADTVLFYQGTKAE